MHFTDVTQLTPCLWSLHCLFHLQTSLSTQTDVEIITGVNVDSFDCVDSFGRAEQAAQCSEECREARPWNWRTSSWNYRTRCLASDPARSPGQGHDTERTRNRMPSLQLLLLLLQKLVAVFSCTVIEGRGANGLTMSSVLRLLGFT